MVGSSYLKPATAKIDFHKIDFSSFILKEVDN